MKTAFAIVALLSLNLLPADATGCRQVVRVQHVQQVYEVVQPVYAAVYQVQPLVIPAYSVGYQATQDQVATQTALQIENLQLKNEILTRDVQQLRQLQQRGPQVLTQPQPVIEQPPAPLPNEQPKKKEPATGKEHPGLSFLQRSCVACHDASVAKAKGGGRAYFDGGKLLTTLTGEQRLEMITAVYSGRMPKGGKQATDEDVAALINFFDPGAAAASK